MPSFGTPSLAGDMGSVTSLAIPKPIDLVDGAIVILGARSQDGNNGVPFTAPAGFVLITPTPALPSTAFRVGELWWKVVDSAAAEPASYLVSGPTGRIAGFAVKYVPDAGQTGPVTKVGSSTYGGSTSGATATMPARTNTAAPSVSFLLLAAEQTAGNSHVPTATPAGYTMVANFQSSLDSSTTGSRTAIWFGYKTEPTTAVASVTGTFANTTSAGIYAGSLTGGVGAPPAPIGIPIKNGLGQTAYLSYLDGAGVRKAPASIRMIHPAFRVANMLATPGVTMGHRGASAVGGMPEMSRRAYRYAASTRNYPLLEFSANRTSDSVYVGCHDASINRTSGLTAGTLPNLSAMTWAEVQAYNNVLNAAGQPAPYFRLDQFLDEFGTECTMHVDPKYNTGGTPQFLDLLDAHGGPDRIVLKYVGIDAAPSAMADLARARGYKTAAYVYATDWASGLLDTWQSHWDILGMEWDASTDVWSRTTTGAFPGIRSYGKPVLAHIIPNQAAYDTVAAKIAEGGWLNPGAGRSWIAQVSGVSSVAPVR